MPSPAPPGSPPGRGAAQRGPAYRLAAPREETSLSYFVTGATGFIGRHLVQELLRNRE
ncbi:MAG: SDR family oxidoreductase, partial [Solirubrobacteraceae bacterium]